MRRPVLTLSLLCALWSPLSAGNGTCSKIQWVTLPAGQFVMGGVRPDQQPGHPVDIKSFAIAKTLVTFKQYRACVAAGKCTPDHSVDGTCILRTGEKSYGRGILPADDREDSDPVVCVDLRQAQAYSEWVGGRLPTEAEWEYAARGGGADQRFPWGDQPATCELAVMEDGTPGCGRFSTWPVCSKPAGNTRQGLCDMAGDAWEWTQDSYHNSYAGAPADGRAWTDGSSERVVRGGSWYGGARPLRSRYRGTSSAEEPVDDVGFRPVKTLGQ